MKVTNIIRVFVIVIITAFLFQVVGVPSDAYARWRDKSDELPGMNDEPAISPIIYVALGLLVVGIIYVIVKNKQAGDGNKEIDKPLEETPESGGDSSYFKNGAENINAGRFKLKNNTEE